MGKCCFKPVESTSSTSFLENTSKNFEEEYTIGRHLGRGQFSEVREASRGSERFAVKIIKLSVIRNELHLLKREIELLSKIECPYIVNCNGIFHTPDYAYILLDLCRGGNLKDKIEKEGPLNHNLVKRVALAILGALSYLHSINITHRDIKPENILFSSQGDPKLADFGLARIMTGTKGFTTVGTPYYLSPEVIDGHYNNKCDVWSLGVVLYYALTARLPFLGDGMEQLFIAIKKNPINWDGVGNQPRLLLEQMLHKNHVLRINASQALENRWLNS